ncbi:MAG: hypothetical protein ACQESV_07315 [Thermodesulfobacteriota bacterium]
MNTVQETLAEVVEQTLEDFAFMFVEDLPQHPPEPPEEEGLYRADINFESPEGQGTLAVIAGGEFCDALARNVLGLEFGEVMLEGAAENALCEFLNVVCGSVVAELYGSEAVVHLSIPESGVCDKAEWELITGSEQALNVIVEGSPLVLVLETQERT